LNSQLTIDESALEDAHRAIERDSVEQECETVESVESYYRRNPVKFRAYKLRDMERKKQFNFRNASANKEWARHAIIHIQKSLAGTEIEKTLERSIFFDSRGVVHNRNLKTGRFQKVPEEI
jgi:hypothetical protein